MYTYTQCIQTYKRVVDLWLFDGELRMARIKMNERKIVITSFVWWMFNKCDLRFDAHIQHTYDIRDTCRRKAHTWSIYISEGLSYIIAWLRVLPRRKLSIFAASDGSICPKTATCMWQWITFNVGIWFYCCMKENIDKTFTIMKYVYRDWKCFDWEFFIQQLMVPMIRDGLFGQFHRQLSHNSMDVHNRCRIRCPWDFRWRCHMRKYSMTN